MTKPKMDSMESLIEKGGQFPENSEVFKNFFAAQKSLIEQQKVLIDWLTDYAAAQKSVQKQHHRFRYVLLPTTIIALLLLSALSLVIFRKTLFPRDLVFPPTNPETNQYILGHPLYSRANWGALNEKEPPPPIPLPTSVVVISHSDSKGCSNFTECSNRMQTIQYRFLEGGNRDIGYNFLIGGEGGIYSGRGWDRQNSVRDKSIAIAFIGDFNKDFATKSAEDAAKALIEEGVKIGNIEPNYKLVGENQTSPLRFYSPGWHMVDVIKRWDHYFSGTML